MLSLIESFIARESEQKFIQQQNPVMMSGGLNDIMNIMLGHGHPLFPGQDQDQDKVEEISNEDEEEDEEDEDEEDDRVEVSDDEDEYSNYDDDDEEDQIKVVKLTDELDDSIDEVIKITDEDIQPEFSKEDYSELLDIIAEPEPEPEPQLVLEEPAVDYKKMNVQQLRQIVVERGLTSDSGKMKKQELLKLLGFE